MPLHGRILPEERDAHELHALARWSGAGRPLGWQRSARAVEAYILGTEVRVGDVLVAPKLAVERSTVQVAVATLAADRALLVEGGRDARVFAQLLCAAISGDSSHVVRGAPSHPGPLREAADRGRLAWMEGIDRLEPAMHDLLRTALRTGRVPGCERPARGGFQVVATGAPGAGRRLPRSLGRCFNTVRLHDAPDARVHTLPPASCSPHRPSPAELARDLSAFFSNICEGLNAEQPAWLRMWAGSGATAEAFRTLCGADIKDR